ncbi:Mob1/phocein [Mycena maculata]|uniref:Mob1/phocein n=1 Tax=Mycena maculata TaxID=230809 RepID=A0AAD7IZ71_9AGAR|nr:Mob1/phocein [Mycena maculata]
MAQVQRPLRGSRISTFYPVKNLPSLSSLDSAFQLQEYISLLIRLDVHDVDAIVSVPGKPKEKGKEKEKDAETPDDGKDRKPEINVDEACWKYEQLRRLAQDLSHPLITMLQQVCTRTTCPEMKAGEWLYLCVAHGNDGAMEQCCAIDYILHTLDSATALLNSPRAFPSRLQIPPTSHRHFSSLARRLGRIFAHAYFHHREEFEQAEAESSLYARFLALTEKFDLVPADFLVIPPRAVAAPGDRRGSVVPLADVPPPTLLGAALHVDTDTAASEAATAGATREKSASPPGLDDAMNPRRYGRNRTDTMMLEGDKDRDGRFPASPASPVSAIEDGPMGLEAALAAAGAEKLLVDYPAVADSPSVQLTPAPQAPAEPEAPSTTPAPEPEPERDQEDKWEPEPEREPPSPTSDEELAPPEGALPIISPSSSTAIQSESRILLDVEQGREEAPAATVTIPTSPVPSISVEPATPPAVDEPEGKVKESAGAAVVEAAVEGGEKGTDAEEVVAAAPAEPVAETVPTSVEPKEESAEAEPESMAAALPAEKPVPTPAVEKLADEEVDVTDTQKDATVAATAVTSQPAEEVGQGEKTDDAEKAGSDVSQP